MEGDCMSYLGRRRKPQQRKAKNALKRPLRAPSMMFDPPMCEHGERPKIEWRDDAKDRKGWLTRLRDWLGL
jgi:hypothetical protein